MSLSSSVVAILYRLGMKVNDAARRLGFLVLMIWETDFFPMPINKENKQ